MSVELKPDERVDDLQLNGLRIIQWDGGFRFGMDAVLLSDFARLKPRERVADMGSGTGILPLLMSQKRQDCTFYAFELQPRMAEMAERSVRLNGLENRITVYAEDMRRAAELLGCESMDAAVCNPPYYKQNSALLSQTEAQRLSRHEEDITLKEIVAACARVLRNQGRLSMIYPAPRLLELCDALRECRLEPKRLRMVCAKADKPPYVAMIEAVKNAKPALLWLPPLIVYDAHGKEMPEIDRIYHRA